MICLNQNLNFEFPLCKSNFIYKQKGPAPDVFISKENVLFASFQYPGTIIMQLYDSILLLCMETHVQGFPKKTPDC